MAQAVVELAVKPRAHGRPEYARAEAAPWLMHRGHAERRAGAVASRLGLAGTDLTARGHGAAAAGLGCWDVVPRQVGVVAEFPSGRHVSRQRTGTRWCTRSN